MRTTQAANSRINAYVGNGNCHSPEAPFWEMMRYALTGRSGDRHRVQRVQFFRRAENRWDRFGKDQGFWISQERRVSIHCLFIANTLEILRYPCDCFVRSSQPILFCSQLVKSGAARKFNLVSIEDLNNPIAHSTVTV